MAPAGTPARHGRTPVLVLVAVLAGLLAPMASNPAGAAVSFGAPSPAAVGAAPDYASEAFSDPWDYENEDDQRLDAMAGMLNVVNQRLEAGRLVFETADGASFDPIITWPGDMDWGRDGALHAIDAARYTRLSFRMRSISRAAGGVFWFNCPTREPSCQGGMPFQVEAGWRTYDLELAPAFAGAPLAWSGQITGLRIMPGNTGVVEVNWMRLYRPTSPVTVQWSDSNPGNAMDLLYDTDDDRSNNIADNPGWGVWATVARSGATNQTPFPAAAYPPGTYRFYAVDAGMASDYSSPLLIDGPPLPVIENPDLAGGAGYASVVQGDAWDFSQPSDLAAVANATDIEVANGVLSATNAGPNPNDPQVELPLAAPIDATRFHRLLFTLSYDGPFGLQDAPGGGTMARLAWTVAGAGPNDYQELEDVVIYQGINRVVVDLATSPPTLVNDEGQLAPKLGWVGRQVTSVRLDPNEDPGARRWHLDDVQLAEDDTGAGAFDIAFRDGAWEEGTTADLFVDSDAAGFDGTRIAAGVPVTAGANVYRWAPTDLAAGTYWVYVVLHDARNTAAAYSTGPVRMSAVSRLAGDDRIDTAVAIAGAAFPDGAAQAVVLARHDNFPDALAGTPLAAASGGPLLLTPPTALDPRTEAAVRRFLPPGRTVYLLGGEGAIGPEVEAAIEQLGYTAVRYAGADRYETAVRIAEGLGRPTRLFLTTGTNFPDALSAGAAAAEVAGAVLLTAGSSMPTATAAYLSANDTIPRFAVGSPAAAADPEATSLSGVDRYETSRIVADRFFANPTFVGVASGANFPDALAGGAHAATRAAPLLLSPPDALAATVRDYLFDNRASIATASLYGGETALSENVRAGVEAAIA
jgi:hypothetical protein